MLEPNELIAAGQLVVDIEAAAIAKLKKHINNDFVDACRYFLSCDGRIIAIGMGKSGHVAKKIAATFASTGTPSFFVHPAEANHGDLGMLTRRDVVLAISYSGETQEVITLLPLIKRLGIPLISLTGCPTSTLAKASSIHLDVSIEQEACPFNLAPTASTTAALAMGDAIAITLLKSRGFTAEDFAFSHPGGSLGRRLLIRVSDVMRTGDQIPCVTADTSLTEALVEMTQKSLGVTLIVANISSHEPMSLVGIYTDGDLRRTLDKYENLRQLKITDVMTANCRSITSDILAAESLKTMETYKITSLPVVNAANEVQGILHLHDIIQAGIV